MQICFLTLLPSEKVQLVYYKKLNHQQQSDMQTEKEDEDDAFPEEYVALSDFTGSGSDQVRHLTRPLAACTLVATVGLSALTVSPLFHSLVLTAVTNCLCTPSLRQSGGGQSCGGSQVTSLRVTCTPMVLRRTSPCRIHGRMKNTSAVMGHWLETGGKKPHNVLHVTVCCTQS